MLTNSDLIALTEFRRALHRRPEVSGEEMETAKTVVAAVKLMCPTRILTGLGGHGVAAIFDSGKDGPTVLFRAELDALPIEERNDAIAWPSEIPGKSHVCGHDGHMTMLLALGRMISRKPVAQGRVILMFQPAEEDGSGAKAVVADPAFDEVKPDWAFAIHNDPGSPFGFVSTRVGLMNCASLGLKVKLSGKTAHAANPQDGVSPALAVAKLIPALDELGHGEGGPRNDAFRLVTITHVNIGEPTFGIAPGEAEVFATLRAAGDAGIESLEAAARTIATSVADEHGLGVAFEIHDHFAASVNDADAYDVATRAIEAIGVPHGQENVPMRASEDFGVFGWGAKAAMLFLGSGEGHAALHNPDYDFPDDLIPIGSAIFERIARDLLGTA
ncbi:amidohydrolase [Loktanella sp. M215]|uniref:amidohydrolase n=1 Tax=Loktanella sp. M215 TaxID=2675431 RepID=UPI001F024192|nr:amidohydrolase [Loktanella sp. M215]MCF7700866.1 amidohydrolase [Loktanella sp. M215]